MTKIIRTCYFLTLLATLSFTSLEGFQPKSIKSLQPLATNDSPVFDYPQNGQTLGYFDAYIFRVFPVPQATTYLWGFFQNGTKVWETQASNEYGIYPCTTAHSKFASGATEVWVRAYTNAGWTDATVITINLAANGSSQCNSTPTATPTPTAGPTPTATPQTQPASRRVPILQLNYFPRDPANSNYLDPTETGWKNGDYRPISDWQTATASMVTAMLPIISEATRFRGHHDSNASRYLEYFIYEKLDFFEKMPRGVTLWWTASRRPNYGQILSNLNICNYVDVLGVKEVWIYGYHSDYIEPDESKMSSKYGDVSNALPKDENISPEFRMPSCQNSYVMYNFTYQLGGAAAIGNTIHNRMHQIENAIFFAENKGYPPTGGSTGNIRGSVFWDDFSVYDPPPYAPGYRASCGNTHQPPNTTTANYDYSNLTYRENNCETWNSDDSKTTYINANCTQWGCTDVGFYKWYMQNIPGYKNEIARSDGCRMRNWWDAMLDFNAFIDAGHSLWDCSPKYKVFMPNTSRGITQGW